MLCFSGPFTCGFLTILLEFHICRHLTLIFFRLYRFQNLVIEERRKGWKSRSRITISYFLNILTISKLSHMVQLSFKLFSWPQTAENPTFWYYLGQNRPIFGQFRWFLDVLRSKGGVIDPPKFCLKFDILPKNFKIRLFYVPGILDDLYFLSQLTLEVV